MMRKVIQIADSTQLVSLPRKWALQHGIKKGDEVEVAEEGNKIIISTESLAPLDKKEIDVSELEPMILRAIVALYKKGVDEIKVTFNEPNLINSVQKLIGKEAVGFEITDQGKNYCIIKQVSGELEDFDPLLRRTLLLLVSMADRTYEALKSGSQDELRNTAFLEEANNRFTTSCRRFLNKKGYPDSRKTGPLYYIVEELENLADQYKYICLHFSDGKKAVKINPEVISVFKKTNEILRSFCEIFYKYEPKKMAAIGKERKEIIKHMFRLLEKTKDHNDTVLLHYSITIFNKIFCLIGPYLVISL